VEEENVLPRKPGARRSPSWRSSRRSRRCAFVGARRDRPARRRSDRSAAFWGGWSRTWARRRGRARCCRPGRRAGGRATTAPRATRRSATSASTSSTSRSGPGAWVGATRGRGRLPRRGGRGGSGRGRSSSGDVPDGAIAVGSPARRWWGAARAMTADVAVVVPNFNGAGDSCPAVWGALEDQTPRPRARWSSSTTPRATARSSFLRSRLRLGRRARRAAQTTASGVGANRGVAARTSTPLVAVLNSDCAAPRPDWLASLVAAPRAGDVWAAGQRARLDGGRRRRAGGGLLLTRAAFAFKAAQGAALADLPETSPMRSSRPPGASPLFDRERFLGAGRLRRALLSSTTRTSTSPSVARLRGVGAARSSCRGAHGRARPRRLGARGARDALLRRGRNSLTCAAANLPELPRPAHRGQTCAASGAPRGATATCPPTCRGRAGRARCACPRDAARAGAPAQRRADPRPSSSSEAAYGLPPAIAHPRTVVPLGPPYGLKVAARASPRRPGAGAAGPSGRPPPGHHREQQPATGLRCEDRDRDR